uniref:Flp family type IVb pilin n=1 Tax=uncultured bacterium A1Q1_fos_1053 TaxID=1256539 RepID=L7VW76_9BACT|nr:hypothetical protein [uncultured bacterium A1Q1_fos_1053]
MLHLYTSVNAMFTALLLADRKEEGATATEYALIIAGIAVAIVAAIAVFGGRLGSFWSGLSTKLSI